MIGLSVGTKPLVFSSAVRNWRETVGALWRRGSCHIDVNLRWVYRAGPVRLKQRGFTGRQSSLTRGEPDSQLSPLKIGFLSPEIRIRLSLLHRGSIRKTCRPPRPRGARSADLAVISPTFDLPGPATTLIPHRGNTPLGVRLLARRALPTAGVIYFFVAPPPSPTLPGGPTTITAQEDKEVSVFTEASRRSPPPHPSICHLHSHFTDSQPILYVQHWY